jgi:hypothetical protein
MPLFTPSPSSGSPLDLVDAKHVGHGVEVGVARLLDRVAQSIDPCPPFFQHLKSWP